MITGTMPSVDVADKVKTIKTSIAELLGESPTLIEIEALKDYAEHEVQKIEQARKNQFTLRALEECAKWVRNGCDNSATPSDALAIVSDFAKQYDRKIVSSSPVISVGSPPATVSSAFKKKRKPGEGEMDAIAFFLERDGKPFLPTDFRKDVGDSLYQKYGPASGNLITSPGLGTWRMEKTGQTVPNHTRGSDPELVVAVQVDESDQV